MKFHHIRSATTIIEYGSVKFLVDPWFDSPEIEYNEPPQPIGVEAFSNHTPISKLPVAPEELLNVDAVIVTHLHYDHFDEEANTSRRQRFQFLFKTTLTQIQ